MHFVFSVHVEKVEFSRRSSKATLNVNVVADMPEVGERGCS